MLRFKIIFLLVLFACKIASSQNIFKYDNNNRLLSITLQNCSLTRFLYDSDGNRISSSFSQILIIDTLIDNTCFGFNTAKILISPTIAGANYNYSWSTGQNNPTISNLLPGIYKVTITDPLNNNTCIKSFEIHPAQQFPISVIPSNISCHGDSTGSAQIDSSAFLIATYSFHWPDGSNGIMAQHLPAGNYSVSVTDSAAQCTQTFPFSISELASNIVSTTKSDASCAGIADGEATVQVVGQLTDYSFTWSDGGSGNVRTGLKADAYSVQVENTRTGCIEIIPITITEPQHLTAVLTVKPNCANQHTGAITIAPVGGTPPYVFSIDSGATYQSNGFSGLDAGAYAVVLQDSHGCEYFSDTAIVEALPQHNLPISALGQMLYSPYASPNIWFDLEDSSLVAAGDSILCPRSGMYYVQGSDNLGCKASSLVFTCSETGVESGERESVFSLFPSPSEGSFTIEFSGIHGMEYKIRVFDAIGKQVLQLKGTSSRQLEDIQVTLPQAAGLYFVQLQQGEEIVSRRMEIMR